MRIALLMLLFSAGMAAIVFLGSYIALGELGISLWFSSVVFAFGLVGWLLGEIDGGVK